MGDLDSSVICLGFNKPPESQCISISSDEAENSDDDVLIVDAKNLGSKKISHKQPEHDIITIEDSPAVPRNVGPSMFENVNKCVESEHSDNKVNKYEVTGSTSATVVKEKKVTIRKRRKPQTTLPASKKQKCDNRIVRFSDKKELGVIVINNNGPGAGKVNAEKKKYQLPTSNSSTVFFTIDKLPSPILTTRPSNTCWNQQVTSKINHEKVSVTIPKRLRPVSIDGSNVAMAHGKDAAFSCYGIKLCIDFFLKRGHTEIKAFVPQYRRRKSTFVKDQHILEDLAKGKQYVVFTPSREVEGSLIASYDDRFIIDYAVKSNGVIVSNDNYRDLMNESAEYRETINNRLLMFAFADDIFMIPRDPLGKNGPNLDKFLELPG